MSLARRVVERWNAVGVSREDDVAGAAQSLDALERLRGIALPASFRELWTLSDGTSAMDDDGFSFWPLDNITSDPGLGPWQGLLVFADFKLGPPHFVLRFEESGAGAVVDQEGRGVATSFDDFLERYLSDPKGVARTRLP